MMVLITSLVSRRARSHPQMALHKAPPTAPAIKTIVSASGRGHPPRNGPTAPAAIAPITNCPSAPIFQSAAENATEIASPVNTSGVAFTSESVKAIQFPNAPCHSAMKTPAGEAPRANSTSEISAMATAIAPAGFPSVDSTSVAPAAGRQQAELFGRAILRIGGANFPLAADHKEPACNRQQLVEIARYEQPGAAIGREFEQRRVHVGGCDQIQSSRQVVSHDHARILGRRARDLQLLPVAAGQRR